MPPELAGPLGALISAITTALLMWAAYQWPAGHHRRDTSDGQPRRRTSDAPDDTAGDGDE